MQMLPESRFDHSHTFTMRIFRYESETTDGEWLEEELTTVTARLGDNIGQFLDNWLFRLHTVQLLPGKGVQLYVTKESWRSVPNPLVNIGTTIHPAHKFGVYTEFFQAGQQTTLHAFMDNETFSLPNLIENHASVMAKEKPTENGFFMTDLEPKEQWCFDHWKRVFLRDLDKLREMAAVPTLDTLPAGPASVRKHAIMSALLTRIQYDVLEAEEVRQVFEELDFDQQGLLYATAVMWCRWKSLISILTEVRVETNKLNTWAFSISEIIIRVINEFEASHPDKSMFSDDLAVAMFIECGGDETVIREEGFGWIFDYN